MRCFFVSDLHGSIRRYEALFEVVSEQLPDAVFIGGDILPSSLIATAPGDAFYSDFYSEFLVPGFKTLLHSLNDRYPAVFLILGNDDGRAEEDRFMTSTDLWTYAHERKLKLGDFAVYGYSYVPPTPFLLKDWEQYDVSRYVDPGCVPPEQGIRTVPRETHEILHSTIAGDLDRLTAGDDMSKAIMLFHSPPYQTCLDRAALDGAMIDSVHLDLHVGSIALRRFIELRGPKITLHGHIHESARITGSWRDRIGKTHMFSAAHDDPKLALVVFDPEVPEKASRLLI